MSVKSSGMDDEKPFSSGKLKSGTFKKRSRSQFDNGKRRMHNSSHDHSSVTPKAIETVYRILCPVEKVGSVLGKGGDIINALRDETHAKITVIDAIPGAEERVIIIFNYPSKQPGSFDTDQDPENANLSENEYEDMRPHCPAQDALLMVHDRITADEYIRGGVVHEKTELDDVVTARILVPYNQVGCLLGKGGSIIKNLRSETGADIRILPAEHLPPCAMDNDELVQISGMPNVVKKALYEVSTRLHQHPRKENPPLEELIYASTQGLYQSGASMPPLPEGNPMLSHQHPGAYGTPPMPWFGGHRNESSGYGHGGFSTSHPGHDWEKAEEFSLRILCATWKIGGVIGKGGVNVRQLEQQTGAKIQVEDTAPEDEERVILVTSKEAPWDPISPTIQTVLQLQSRTSASSENGMVTTRLLVPSSKVGCILGQGGNIISEIRRRTRAGIRVYSKDDKPKYTSDNEELVQISGNPTVAKEALLEIASRLRTRTYRAGNAAVNPALAGPVQGFALSGSMPGRGLPSYGMIGAGNSIDYEHPKGARPRLEVQGYSGQPTATGYSAGPRQEAHGYSGPPTATGYSAGPRHEAQGYPGPPPSTGYTAGPRHEAQGYPGAATASAYSAGPRHEAQGYPGPPTSTGYSAGLRHEAQGYSGQPTPAGFGAGSRHEAQGYSGQPTSAGYGTGSRHEAQGYPGPPTSAGYSSGSRHEAQGYPGPPTSAGYSAGPRHEAQGYSGPPTSAGYSAGPRHEAQGYYSGPPTSAGYSAGSRHEAQGYPGPPTPAGYNAGSRHEAQGYPGPPTSAEYSAGPRYEGQGYSGPPTSTGYSAGARHEGQSYPGPPTSTGYSAGPRHEAQGYPGPPTVAGYPNINSSMEVRIPNSAVPSVLGTGGTNISDIRQISGAKVKLHDPISGASECVVEIHGSSGQIKAAQSLLQAFAASGGQTAPPSLSSQVPRPY